VLINLSQHNGLSLQVCDRRTDGHFATANTARKNVASKVADRVTFLLYNRKLCVRGRMGYRYAAILLWFWDHVTLISVFLTYTACHARDWPPTYWIDVRQRVVPSDVVHLEATSRQHLPFSITRPGSRSRALLPRSWPRSRRLGHWLWVTSTPLHDQRWRKHGVDWTWFVTVNRWSKTSVGQVVVGCSVNNC